MTVKVKLLTSRVGPAGAFNRGDEIDVETAEAKRMVDAGQAEYVRSKPIERAVKPKRGENASKS